MKSNVQVGHCNDTNWSASYDTIYQLMVSGAIGLTGNVIMDAFNKQELVTSQWQDMVEHLALGTQKNRLTNACQVFIRIFVLFSLKVKKTHFIEKGLWFTLYSEFNAACFRKWRLGHLESVVL